MNWKLRLQKKDYTYSAYSGGGIAGKNTITKLGLKWSE